jgi:hypothetical protein
MEVMWLAISVPIMEIEREQQGAKRELNPNDPESVGVFYGR